MLVILAILYLQHFISADAVPLSVVFQRQTDIGPSLPQECVCPDTRSGWDIAWSCLVTIFACSWVSIHPNIPGPKEKRWKKAIRRLELMVWSIISPELILYWASTQWAGARDLANKYAKDGWTKTHGYFIQMGGFMLYDGNKAVGVLGPEELEVLLQEEKVAMPTITEGEIKDRSKGDGLAKALVIIQTTWFIVQCIARRIRGLIITELELVTLAFAALNVVMYAYWWNKPLDVQTTVPVYLLHPTPPQSPTHSPRVEDGPVGDDGASNAESSSVRGNKTSNLQGSGSDIELENLVPSAETRTQQRSNRLELRQFARQAWRVVSGILFRWPAAGVVAVLLRMRDITSSNTILPSKMRVNTFYSYDPILRNGDSWMEFAFAFVGILFGAIHCAGWNFFFPSHIEAYVWRVSSAIITGVPVMGMVGSLAEVLDRYVCQAGFMESLPSKALEWLTIVMIPFYVLARLALLVEALISLRDLPQEALTMVEWTSFVPHI